MIYQICISDQDLVFKRLISDARIKKVKFQPIHVNKDSNSLSRNITQSTNTTLGTFHLLVGILVLYVCPIWKFQIFKKKLNQGTLDM